MGLGNELNWVGTTGVLSNADIVIIGAPGDRTVYHVLEDAAKSDSVVNFRFLLGRKVDAFGIASTLDVENTRVRPDMFIVTDQKTVWISRQRRLACAR